MSGGNPGKPMEKPKSKARGNLSVNTEISDKTSSPKNLSDMPMDVVRLIIERSDYKEQLVLRKVSKSLRKLVDQKKPACTDLHLQLKPHWIRCYYNKVDASYMPPTRRNIELKRLGTYENYNLIVSDDYEKIAFDDLASTLKNPKLQLENLLVDFHGLDSFYSEIWAKYRKFRKILESINLQISTKKFKFDICRPSNYFSILPFLKPGVLEEINVWYESDSFEWNEKELSLNIIKQVSELEQWKQAKQLTLEYSLEAFPLEYATHFKQIHFHEEDLDADYLNEVILEDLSESPNLEYCSIWADMKWDTQELHATIGQPAPRNKRTKYVSHYPIPDSEDYLEIMFLKHTIEITRKTKK